MLSCRIIPLDWRFSLDLDQVDVFLFWLAKKFKKMSQMNDIELFRNFPLGLKIFSHQTPMAF